MTYEPSAEILGLINHVPLHDAQAQIDEAQRRYQEAADLAREAEAAVSEAYRAIPELTQRAVSGERVTPTVVAKAYQRVRDAEAYRDFYTEVTRRLKPDEREAEGRLARAKAAAFQPLLDHAAERRIAAAARADRAGGTPDRNPDHAELHAAKSEYTAASAVMHFALRHGARHPGSMPAAVTYALPGWPSTEQIERDFWGRPESKQDIAA